MPEYRLGQRRELADLDARGTHCVTSPAIAGSEQVIFSNGRVEMVPIVVASILYWGWP